MGFRNEFIMRGYFFRKERKAQVKLMITFTFLLSFGSANLVFAQYTNKPVINCSNQCTIPPYLDTLLVFPARIWIDEVDFFGNLTYDWKRTGQTKDSLNQALLEYFNDSIFSSGEGVQKRKSTVGLKFSEFDSIRRKLIYDSIPSILYKVTKRLADTTMYVPEFFYWMLEQHQERFGLLIKISGHVKKESVFRTQQLLHLISPVSPGYKSMYQTFFTCYIVDKERREVIYSGSYAEVLPANYKSVIQHFLKQFFDNYLEKK